MTAELRAKTKTEHGMFFRRLKICIRWRKHSCSLVNKLNQSLIKHPIMEKPHALPDVDNLVPNAITLHFMHLPMVANSFYGSKFTARYDDGNTALHIEDDYTLFFHKNNFIRTTKLKFAQKLRTS